MLKLNEELSFSIEPNKKKARLIVFKGCVENVCRKETFKNLEHFVRSNEDRIFKGRLQLHKSQGGIGIEIKGEIAGIIKTEDFINYLEKVKQ